MNERDAGARGAGLARLLGGKPAVSAVVRDVALTAPDFDTAARRLNTFLDREA